MKFSVTRLYYFNLIPVSLSISGNLSWDIHIKNSKFKKRIQCQSLGFNIVGGVYAVQKSFIHLNIHIYIFSSALGIICIMYVQYPYSGSRI